MLRDKIYLKKRLENDKKYKLDRIDLLRSRVPSSWNENDKVEGGLPQDQMLEVICQIQKMEEEVKYIEMELSILQPRIDEDFSALKELDPIVKKIVELREIYNLTWDEIAVATNYSKRQCIRIYNEKYKYVEDVTKMSL